MTSISRLPTVTLSPSTSQRSGSNGSPVPVLRRRRLRLRAEVDAYGPLGWQYVERHYRRHGWRRSLDKLDPEQRRELAALIERVRAASPEAPDQDAEETLKPSRSGI